MKKTLKTKLISRAFVGLCVFLLGCNSEDMTLPTMSGANNNGGSGNTEYLSGKWAHVQNSPTTPLTPLVISEDFTQTERDMINEMARLWQDHPGDSADSEDSAGENLSLEATGTQFYNLPLTVVEGLPKTKKYTATRDYQDSEMGIYKLTTWPREWGTFALAVTQFFGYRRNVGSSSEYIELTHADIIVNAQNFTFSSSSPEHPDSNSAFTFDLPSVVLHEIGHFLGLPHVSSMTDSVMVPTIGMGTRRRSPRDLDIKNLMKIYPAEHLSFQAMQIDKSGPVHPDEGAFVKGTIELMENGECRHVVDGKVVYVHQHMDNKQKFLVK